MLENVVENLLEHTMHFNEMGAALKIKIDIKNDSHRICCP